MKIIRPAFTLIEILVVIAIIAILTALTAAGVFQVISAQRNANTRNTMKAVAKALQQQMRWVIDKADKEPIPASVLALATPPTGADPQTPKRARVIWKMLRLKQEFPMSFAEALYPHLTYADVNVTPPWGWVPAQSSWAIYNLSTGALVPTPLSAHHASPIHATDLPPKASYVHALKNVAPANCGLRVSSDPRYPINPNGWPFIESSTCLLLALQEKRGGTSFNIDELGAAAIDLNGDGLKELVDAWNNPIAFFRFATSNDLVSSTGIPLHDNAFNSLNNSLDASNPAGPSDTAYKFRDPYDSEGTLVNPGWNYQNLGTIALSVQQFEQLGHVIHVPNASATPVTLQSNYNNAPWGGLTSNGSRYMVPVLVSAGRDGKWGINSMFSSTQVGVLNQTGVNPDMSIDPATIDANGNWDGGDNFFSFQLQ